MLKTNCGMFKQTSFCQSVVLYFYKLIVIHSYNSSPSEVKSEADGGSALKQNKSSSTRSCLFEAFRDLSEFIQTQTSSL